MILLQADHGHGRIGHLPPFEKLNAYQLRERMSVFSAYRHARATAGWRGRRAAWLAIIGLATLLFNFYAVNTVIVGLHSYGG